MTTATEKIKGHRELTKEELAFVNTTKSIGPQLEQLTKDIREYLNARIETAKAFDKKEHLRIQQADPIKWLEIGTVHLQEGLMALNRCITQNKSF